MSSSPIATELHARRAGRARRGGAVSWIALSAAGLLAVVLGTGGWAVYRYWWIDWKTESYRRTCEEAREAQNWAEQERVAKEWTEWDPDQGKAWVYRALAAKKQNELEKAADYFGSVPPDDPRALQAYMMKATYELDLLNRPFEGLETCRRILKLNPEVMQARARLISFYAMTMQRPELLQAIRRAIDAGAEPKEAYVYLVLADDLVFTNAVGHTTRWLSAHPDSELFRVGRAVHEAQLYSVQARAEPTEENRQRQAEADRRLQELLQEYPHNPALLGYLMRRHKEAGDVEAVGRLLRQVDDEAAADYMMWVYRGWYHASRGELQQADEAYRRALEMHPLSMQARQAYAAVLRQLQGPEDEVQQMQELAVEGRRLRQRLRELPSARDAGVEEFRQIASFAARCGDTQVAEALQKRLAEMTGRSSGIQMPGTSSGLGVGIPADSLSSRP